MLEGIHLGDAILIAVIGIVVIAAVAAIAPRVGVAGPLVLVAIGIGFSLLPFTPNPYVEPELILIGVLPPLLYAAAVSLPAMEFRRDFGMVGALSIILVLLTSLALGLFFAAVIPGIGLPLGIALGAVLSPTDAVATTIVKKLGISPRIVTVLEGESLFNDATALVLLGTAVTAIQGKFSLGASVLAFLWAVVSAVAIGLVVGWVNLHLRRLVHNSAAATALSFVVPYVAYLPTEHLGGSGLVAAVVAGIVTGQGAARYFTAEQRLSDRVNWHTIELLLEGAVFLIMGLEVMAIINDTPEKMNAIGHAALLAGGAVLIVLAMRGTLVAPLVWWQTRRVRRSEGFKPRLESVQERISTTPAIELTRGRKSRHSPEQLVERFSKRVTRSLADIAYLESSPLGWREGTIIVWAGMRGVVTLAAAQTLPHGPNRSFLVLIAFIVAVGTLVLQGSTLGPLVKALGLAGSRENDPASDQLAEIDAKMREAATAALENPELAREDGTAFDASVVRAAHSRLSMPREDDDDGSLARELRELRLVMIQAQRDKLTKARSNGRYGTAVLRQVLESLDADELSIRAHLDEDD